MAHLLFFLFLSGAVRLQAGENPDAERLRSEAARLEAALIEAPGDRDLLLEAGVLHYELAAFFGAPAADAVARLEAAHRIDGSAAAKARLGAACALAARSSGDVFERFFLAQRAMRLADEAAAESPDDPLVRLLRAENSHFLPDLFERTNIADADFEYLFTRLRNDRHAFNGLFDPARVFYFRALQFAKERRMDQAYRYALAGRKIAVDDFIRGRLEEFLKGFEEEERR